MANASFEGDIVIRSQETLNLLLDSIIRFVRERLVPNEEIVAETDQIPAALLRPRLDHGRRSAGRYRTRQDVTGVSFGNRQQ
jgi:hypothetical protein